MGTGDMCRVPPSAVCHGRARQNSGMGRVGIVEGSCGYRACGVSILGKFVLSTKPGYKTRWVVILLNVVLTPESKLRYGT